MRCVCPLLCCPQLPPLARGGPGRPRGGRRLARLARPPARRHLPRNRPLARLAEGGPKLAWKAKGIGEGFSGPAVVGNVLYTMGNVKAAGEERREFVFAPGCQQGRPAVVGVAHRSDSPRGRRLSRAPLHPDDRRRPPLYAGHQRRPGLHGHPRRTHRLAARTWSPISAAVRPTGDMPSPC